MFENLNLRPLNIKKVYDFIEKNRPELLEKYKQIYDKKDNSYWDSLKEKIQKLCSDCEKEARIYFHHGGFN